MKQQKKEIKVKAYPIKEKAGKKQLSRKEKQTLIISMSILAIIAVSVITVKFAFNGFSGKRNAADATVPTASPTMTAVAAEADTQMAGPAYLQPFVEKNFNTVGYIKIEGTRVDYPVLQTDDNDYYIDHNFEGEEDVAGSIFLDYRCDINDFSKTRNIILYGHRMKDGSQFRDLINYEDVDFFREHRIISFDTINEMLRWEVFAAFETTIEDYYIETIFQYDEEWIDFLESHHEKSLCPTYMSFYPEDIVLTLSTCTTREDGRFVVMAKLIK